MANRRAKSRNEIKSLGEKELLLKQRELENHIFQLRMQWKTGQLASTSMMGLARRELARLKTAMRTKQLAIKQA